MLSSLFDSIMLLVILGIATCAIAVITVVAILFVVQRSQKEPTTIVVKEVHTEIAANKQNPESVAWALDNTHLIEARVILQCEEAYLHSEIRHRQRTLDELHDYHAEHGSSIVDDYGLAHYRDGLQRLIWQQKQVSTALNGPAPR